jgi:hypothetical protein
VDFTIPIVDSNVVVPVGGRLSHFVTAWRSLTDDPWVLRIIEEGYLIDFIETPIQNSIPPECVMDDEKSALCDAEVVTLLAKCAIVKINFQTESGLLVPCLLFLRKRLRALKKFRPILNLKRLNSFVRYEHFKMEGLDSVKYLLKPNDWLVKIDLQDEYFLVPVAAQHRKYLRFFWKRVYTNMFVYPLVCAQPPGCLRNC